MSEFIGQLDLSFQRMLLALLMQDTVFISRARAIVRPEYFTSDAFRVIAKCLFEYWDEFRTLPDTKVLAVKVSHRVEDGEIRDDYVKLVKYVADTKDIDHPFVQRELVTFAQRAQAMNAVLMAADDPKHFSILSLRNDLDKIVKLGHIFTEVGMDLRNHWSIAVMDETEEVFKVGCPGLDDAMRGGLRAGELMSVLAPLKRGKTNMLVNMGYWLAQEGRRVAHYTFEITDIGTVRRYVGCATGKPVNQLRDFITEVNQGMRQLDSYTEGNVMVKEFPGYITTVEMIESHLALLEDGSGEPWIPVIDYADLLSSGRKTQEEWLRMEEVYVQLRNLGRRHGVPVLTASQTNVSGFNAETLGPEHFASSTRKGFVCDYVFAIQQNERDIKANRFMLANVLNRNARKAPNMKWLARHDLCQLYYLNPKEGMEGLYKKALEELEEREQIEAEKEYGAKGGNGAVPGKGNKKGNGKSRSV